MRRNNEEFANAVFERSKILIAKRNRRIKVATGCISAGLCIACVFLLTQQGFAPWEERLPMLENSGVGPEYDSPCPENMPNNDGATDIFPEAGDESVDGPQDESMDGVGNGDDDVSDGTEEGIPESGGHEVFRGMEIIDIEGNVITLLDASGHTVIYWMTEDGLYDVAKDEMLELSQAEREFWEEIFSEKTNK